MWLLQVVSSGGIHYWAFPLKSLAWWEVPETLDDGGSNPDSVLGGLSLAAEPRYSCFISYSCDKLS